MQLEGGRGVFLECPITLGHWSLGKGSVGLFGGGVLNVGDFVQGMAFATTFEFIIEVSIRKAIPYTLASRRGVNIISKSHIWNPAPQPQ